MTDSSRKWFALYTKPRSEFKAEAQITAQGIKAYLPSVTRLKQWSDRKKQVTEALLTGYLFVYASEPERISALACPAVVRCVSERGRPAVIPDCQIENLMNFIQRGTHFTVVNTLVKGSRVRFKDGPFRDIEGIVIEEPDGKSLAVTIDLLNRSIVTHVTDNDVIELIHN